LRTDELLALFREKERTALHGNINQITSVLNARLKIFLSYKIWMLVELLNSVVSIAVYYFFGVMVESEKLEAAGYGTSYLSFALIGIASQTFLWTCVARIAFVLRVELQEGTFEALNATRLKIHNFLFGQSLSGFILSMWFFTSAMLSGIFVLSASLTLTPETIITSIIIIILMILAHIGIGFIAAGGVLILKRGDPIVAVFAVLTQFLSGVLFPLEVLPPELEAVAKALPFTYALRSLRFALLAERPISDPTIIHDIIFCGIFAIALIPLGIWFFGKAHNYAKTRGTTGHY